MIEQIVTNNINSEKKRKKKTKEMKTMKEYYDLYVKCDVLLLADVFEKPIDNSLKNYGLCPSHYLRAPGSSWDAFLK